MSDSITHGVRWDLATSVLADRGVDTWIQVPPSDGLLRLVPAGRTFGIDTLGVAEVVRRVRRSGRSAG